MNTENTSAVELTDREKELRERVDSLVREAKKEHGQLSFQAFILFFKLRYFCIL